jgi:putative DNA primase/helicase
MPDFNVEGIPAELRQRDQWVCWKLEPKADRAGNSKMTKVPYCAHDGTRASSTDPRTWAPFSKAVQAARERGFAGVGFILTEGDPYVGIDLDNAVDENGEIRPEQAAILRELKSYTEWSQSRKGLHAIVRGATPNGEPVKKGDAFGPGQGLEIYSQKRFWVMTGNRLETFPENIEGRASQIETLFRRFKPVPVEEPEDFPDILPPVLDDEIIIRKAVKARNGEKFKRLWEGDASGYSSSSEADEALCCLLAYWTKDPEQIDRLFRRSALFRAKWDERHGAETYGATAIRKAISLVKEAYSGGIPRSGIPFLTDVGNAERLVSRFGETLRYCEPLNGWHVWDGVRWKEDKEHRAIALAKETVRMIFSEAAEEADENRRRDTVKHALASERAPRIHAMLDMAKPELAMIPEALDADPMTLNCPNGLLDLRNGELLRHTPGDMVSKVTGTEYKPGAERIAWERFLTEIFAGKADLIRFIQKAVGYSLTGDTREQCFFILYGEGANGKSTFLETLAYALGDYAGTASPETFLATKQPKNVGDDLAALKGRRLVATSETGRGRKWDESRVKQLSGGDTLICRKLFCEYFSYKPTWKIWMATNHKPNFDANDQALFRRIRLIPFTVTFPPDKQDRGLSDRLKAEAEGILAWAVEGALLWQKEGLESPEEVRMATEGYRHEQDSLGRFLAEECIQGDLDKVLAKDFKAHYAEWCRENGENGVPTREVGQCLEKLGIERAKRNGAWYFLGLTFNPSDVGTLSDVEFQSPLREKCTPNHSETTSLNVTTSLKTGILNLEEA